jgi:hypothetical protein
MHSESLLPHSTPDDHPLDAHFLDDLTHLSATDLITFEELTPDYFNLKETPPLSAPSSEATSLSRRSPNWTVEECIYFIKLYKKELGSVRLSVSPLLPKEKPFLSVR